MAYPHYDSLSPALYRVEYSIVNVQRKPFRLIRKSPNTPGLISPKNTQAKQGTVPAHQLMYFTRQTQKKRRTPASIKKIQTLFNVLLTKTKT